MTDYASLHAPPTVLIAVVDDDASVRQALLRLVRSLGYEVSAFSNATEFLQSRAFQNAGCLILDIQMPGLDGLGLLSVLTALKSNIPTIFITAHADENVRERAAAMRAVGLLEKPFDDQSLIALIQKARTQATRS